MKEDNYTDRVLLKLRRQYSKDETIAALNSKVSQLEQKNGELNAEIDHLNFEFKNLEKSLKQKLNQELRQTIFLKMQNKITEKDKTITGLRKNINELIVKLNK